MPVRGNTDGRARTCAEMPAAARKSGSGCAGAWKISGGRGHFCASSGSAVCVSADWHCAGRFLEFRSLRGKSGYLIEEFGSHGPLLVLRRTRRERAAEEKQNV